MELIHISDTYGAHNKLNLIQYKADVLVHSGNFT